MLYYDYNWQDKTLKGNNFKIAFASFASFSGCMLNDGDHHQSRREKILSIFAIILTFSELQLKRVGKKIIEPRMEFKINYQTLNSGALI